MLADLDDLLTALYVLVDDLLPARQGASRRPRITAAELITLAVAQILLHCHSERRFLRLARKQLGHLFPNILEQPGHNRRLRSLAPEICQVIAHLARISPSFWERIRLLDSTPVPCGRSRETRKRSELACWASYGYCATHSRYFWGLRLYLLCAPDGMPISFCLAPANEPEREVAAAMLDRRSGQLTGQEIIISDKGFAGREFEQTIASLDATLIRPDRKNEKPRFGKLGGIRQWIESINGNPQRPTLARGSRRPHRRRRLGTRLPTRTHPRRRRLAQLAALGSRTHQLPKPTHHQLRPLNP